MAQSKFTLFKYIKLADGYWRYCKATFYSNGKIKPNRCIIGGKEEEQRSLADAMEEWRNETEANRKRKTYLAYTKSSEYFLQFSTKATVDGVDRKDMLNFKI